jgi:aspartate/methionine/tyrosine aminotransferase
VPGRAIVEAASQGISPDTLYAVDLLQKTGICVVPASGFRQKEGRFGFRTTFLPPEEEMRDAVTAISKHYLEFCKKFS